MIKPFEFYFDFISPYSFLAHKKIKKIEKKNSVKIIYRPILLGGLHNLHGIKAPAFIPAKAKNMIRDCKLIAEKDNVKFKFNSYFPIKSLNLMRGVFVAEEDNCKNYYIERNNFSRPNKLSGGEGGIRTLGRGKPTHAFQACALNRSATSPSSTLSFQR